MGRRKQPVRWIYRVLLWGGEAGRHWADGMKSRLKQNAAE